MAKRKNDFEDWLADWREEQDHLYVKGWGLTHWVHKRYWPKSQATPSDRRMAQVICIDVLLLFGWLRALESGYLLPEAVCLSLIGLSIPYLVVLGARARAEKKVKHAQRNRRRR